MAVAVNPVGRVSVTVTVPLVGPVPLLLAGVVEDWPICPWVKLTLWVLVMVRSGVNNGLEVVASEVVSFPVLVSLPPETATVLVTEAAALAATLTVSVIAG